MTKRNNTPFLEVSSITCLRQAWKKIYDNGIRSKSDDTKYKVIEFKKNDDTYLRRIQSLLRKEKFEFNNK